jgi:single-stranded DNA-binding protein
MKEYLTKGKGVFVSGQVKIDTYQAKTGEWTSAFDVFADRIDFVSLGSGQQQGDSAPVAAAPPQKVTTTTASPIPPAKPEAVAAAAASVSEAVKPTVSTANTADVTDGLPF